MFGENQRGREAIGIMTETFAGAGGARSFADGVDIGGEIPNPISRMANVETVEAMFPIRYLSRKRLRDSGGPGEFRGGTGGELAVVPHDAPNGGLDYVLSGKGSQFPQSEGIAGGDPGAINDYVWVHAPDDNNGSMTFAQTLEAIPGKKEPISWGVFPLTGADALYVRWNGGGGTGDPLNRDVSKVADDLFHGAISETAASEIYGVVEKSGRIDPEATTALRAQMRRSRVLQGKEKA